MADLSPGTPVAAADTAVPEVAPEAPPAPRRRQALWLALASAVWTLPLWAVALPPMLDFPQQLTLAAIVRWYGDPARMLQPAYDVDNLLAYPLLLAGVFLADRAFDERFGGLEWLLLALCSVLFYGVHLQFLLLFAGALAWFALVRRPGWRRMALWLSPLLPGLLLGVGVLAWAHVHASEVMTAFQERLDAGPTLLVLHTEKLRRMPGLLFGAYRDGLQWILALFNGSGAPPGTPTATKIQTTR